jgi:hypothetical protein
MITLVAALDAHTSSPASAGVVVNASNSADPRLTAPTGPPPRSSWQLRCWRSSNPSWGRCIS